MTIPEILIWKSHQYSALDPVDLGLCRYGLTGPNDVNQITHPFQITHGLHNPALEPMTLYLLLPGAKRAICVLAIMGCPKTLFPRRGIT